MLSPAPQQPAESFAISDDGRSRSGSNSSSGTSSSSSSSSGGGSGQAFNGADRHVGGPAPVKTLTRRHSLVFEQVVETVVLSTPPGKAGDAGQAALALPVLLANDLPLLPQEPDVSLDVLDELPLGSTNVNELPPRQYLRDLVATRSLSSRDAVGAASLLLVHHDAPAACELLQLRLAGCEPADRAHVLFNLGVAKSVTGEHTSAVHILQQAAGLFRDAHDMHGQLLAVVNAAACLLLLHDFGLVFAERLAGPSLIPLSLIYFLPSPLMMMMMMMMVMLKQSVGSAGAVSPGAGAAASRVHSARRQVAAVPVLLVHRHGLPSVGSAGRGH
jgi:hypothetical protein